MNENEFDSFEPDFNHPVFGEVADLGLPEPDQFVINHSAALAIFGMLDRTPNDIDAATSLRNIRFLRKDRDFPIERRVVGYTADGRPITILVSQDEDKRFDVHRWEFSLKQYRETGLGRIALRDIIPDTAQHPTLGIRVAVPRLVLATKEDTGRPQDEQDILYAHRLLREKAARP